MALLRPSRARRALISGICGVAVLASLPAAPAYAWKPKTHIYLAEEVLRDALDNDKVTIYQTDYHTGRIVGVLGEFPVDPAILAALRASPQQFRAGVLGPDAYPDILTGQQVIHPEAAEAIENHGAGGSNAWLSHLWQRGFVDSSSPQVRAFTLGYLTHAAGDVFAHTYVNHFAGGEFALTPDPTNAVKHLVLEGYIGKRTPATVSAVSSTVVSGAPANQRKREDLGREERAPTRSSYRGTVTQDQTSIAGVETFIYQELTYARPGSVLEDKLMKGQGTTRSIPFVFSTLRNGLQAQVEAYDRERMNRDGPARAAYAVLHGPIAEYKREWIKDIDDGLAAFPAVSHEIAKAIVYNEGGSDMARAKAVMNQYVVDHLASMAGTPDALVATAAFISRVIDAILPPPAREGLRAMMQAPMDLLIKGVSGRTADEWADYLKNPETHFDEIMTRPGGGHGGESDHQIDLATFNRDYLKIDDEAYKNPSLKWKIEDLPPAFNTVQLTKLMLLGDEGLAQLKSELAAEGAALGENPGQFRNLMLGWIRSLDAGNQWQGGGAPQPAFAAQGGSAYRILFLNQVGEKPWIAGQDQGQGAPAPTAPPQDLAPFAGDWVTTYGRVTLKVDPDGVLRGRLMVRNSEGSERESDRLELHDGGQAGVLTGVSLYAAHRSDVVLTFDPERQTFTGVSQAEGNTSKNNWGGQRAAAPAPQPQPAPSPTSPPAQTPAQAPESQPASPGRPVAQAGVFHELEDFDVRFDRAVAARNGSVQVFLTVRNTTRSNRSIGAGVFKAVMTDIDGVGVSESQIWRATSDAPESFSATPVVAPGDEFSFRFVMSPASRVSPLSAVAIRESDARSIVFDVSGVTVGQVAPPAAGAGSGGFKALSELDVRIDGVARGRDGRMEVFLTLRNPGDRVRTTSKGWIKISAQGPDGARITTRSALYPIRGPRAAELPLLVYIEPGREARLRYLFEASVSGPMTISDGSIEQVFTAGR
ncbi:MAG TPA: hypothetical protein VLZ51_05695 [Brevundimonas sp.]|nr:hypothetical protein [Brevundimonas sp.]